MNRQTRLLDWIKKQHEGQLIRKTTAPYLDHLVFVAGKADIIPLAYETGLCHDLFEKTLITEQQLKNVLTSFGYDNNESNIIARSVNELTNVYTKKAYPKLTNKTRKKKEADRSSKINPIAQTVKYADLIYNIHWMLKYDLKHAGQYLKNKKQLLTMMRAGNPVLLKETSAIIEEGIIQINRN